jgi:hypothetical protein
MLCVDSANRTLTSLLENSEFVLEAFGNAKTLNNANSSRFVRHLNLTIGHTGRLLGAAVHGCLLERTRVCGLSPGENFHIFRYIESGDRKMLNRIDKWLTEIGFIDEEVEGVHDLLQAVMLVQQLPINEDTGLVDGRAVSRDLADALGCSKEEFAKEFNTLSKSALRGDSKVRKMTSSLLGDYKALHDCQIKAKIQRTSPSRGTLRKGEVIKVLERQELGAGTGVMRLRFKRGWVTERSNDGAL